MAAAGGSQPWLCSHGVPVVLQVPNPQIPKSHGDRSPQLLHPHPSCAAGDPPAKILLPGLLLPSQPRGMGLCCPRRLCPQSPGAEVAKAPAGDRDSWNWGFCAPPPRTGLSAAPHNLCTHGQFSVLQFCKTILSKNLALALLARLQAGNCIPLLEIPPGVSDGECTTSLSILSCCHTF